MLQTSRTKKNPTDKGICGDCANPCQNQPDGMYAEMMVLEWCEGLNSKKQCQECYADLKETALGAYQCPECLATYYESDFEEVSP